VWESEITISPSTLPLHSQFTTQKSDDLTLFNILNPEVLTAPELFRDVRTFQIN
jgi:hypothetical protein